MGRLEYRTLRENIADAIRMKIINKELKPGDRIVEAELANEFGISRGPVREALRQLENEGLIEYTRNIGCSVKQITIQDSYEIYFMRIGYETMAVKLVGGKISDETLARMEATLDKMKNLDVEHYDDVFVHDNEFHGELVKMVNMPRLYQAWCLLNYGSVISGYAEDLDKKRVVSRQYILHKELMDACRTGNTERICRAISEHYMKTIKHLLKEQGITGEEAGFCMDFLL
ncbi:MAG: GntR family transcriptional regulator [Lachnospiraceae bacterium]|nr:GntR family transcriptional regulator [Lachnospiraceae bacterium]